MTYEILIGILGFLSACIVIVKPILTLSNNITRLTASVDQLNDNFKHQESRIDVQDSKIDNLNVAVADHEVRIKVLEK